MTDGLIYYVLDATRQVQYLKIGFTTDLARRVIALRGISTSGQPPLVLALEEGDTRRERERHREFAELRSHGEWFRYEGVLVKFLAEMEHPFAYLLDRPHLWQYSGGWGPLEINAHRQKPWNGSLASLDEGPIEVDEDNVERTVVTY